MKQSGMFDKNKVEIKQGDIVMVALPEKDCYWRGVVRCYGLYFEIQFDATQSPLSNYASNAVEVIGNIFE